MGCTLSFSHETCRASGHPAYPPQLIDVIERTGQLEPRRLIRDRIDAPRMAREQDEFDSIFAQYLIVKAQNSSAILGSLRILPTDRAHLLDTLFPDLCADQVPRGSSIKEVSSIFLHPELGRNRRMVILQLASALAQFGILTGISSYTTVMETIWSDYLASIGWHCVSLGPDRIIAGVSLRASQIHLDNNTLRALRDRNCLVECELHLADMSRSICLGSESRC